MERRNFSDSTINHTRAEKVDNYSGKLQTTVIGNSKKRQKSLLQEAQKKLATSGGGDQVLEDHLKGYFSKIREICTLLDLERRVYDTARDLIFRYKDHHRRKMTSLDAAVAVVHLACSQLHIGRTMADIVCDLKIAGGYDHLDDRDIWAARKKFVQALPGIDAQIRPEDVIHNFCSLLQASQAVRRVSSYIHEKMQPLVEGKTVSTIAAGTIMLACEALEDRSITRDNIAGIAGIATTTLVNFCKIGRRHWTHVVPTPAELEKLRNL